MFIGTTMEEFVYSASNSELLPVFLLVASIVAIISITKFLLLPTE